MSLRWTPPIALSSQEELIIKRCKAKKLFAFLRLQRHQIFDDAFQQELAGMYGPQAPGGTEVVAPAQLAMVTLMQAAFGVSDAEAVEEAATSLRWQMVLDCVGAPKAPFSQGSLPAFRARLMAHQMDRRLLEKSVQVARQVGGFGPHQLRVALDSSPLFGASRVEDTINLIGHAAKEVVRTAAKRLGLSPHEVAQRAGIGVLNGSSIKAALDVDWDESGARTQALSTLLDQVENLTAYLVNELAEAMQEPPLKEQLETLGRLVAQDTEPEPDPPPDPEGPVRQRHKQGVAKDRQISVREPQMRHGRKSKSSRVDGYKRHLAVDLDTGLVLAAAVRPANQAEAEAAQPLLEDVAVQGQSLAELHIDRGYLAASCLQEHKDQGVEIVGKAYPLRNGPHYSKTAFHLDVEHQQVTCPAGVVIPLRLGQTVHFPGATCQSCAQRQACTPSKQGRGRSLHIHEQEAFHQQLREQQRTAAGRARLRLRSRIEHRLSHVGRSQGRRARYQGERKNLMDVRRHSAVANLHIANRYLSAVQASR